MHLIFVLKIKQYFFLYFFTTFKLEIFSTIKLQITKIINFICFLLNKKIVLKYFLIFLNAFSDLIYVFSVDYNCQQARFSQLKKNSHN